MRKSPNKRPSAKGCNRLVAKPTNKMSRNNAPMRTQKPARGMAAVICGDRFAAGGGAEYAGDAGDADAKGGAPDANGSAAAFGGAAAAAAAPGAAPGAGVTPAVQPGPAMAAALFGGGLLRPPGVAPANAGGGVPPARRARTRSTKV